jgi:hypothetical protein
MSGKFASFQKYLDEGSIFASASVKELTGISRQQGNLDG